MVSVCGQSQAQEGVANMPRRGEHIHKRKDGRWEARYKCGTSANGKTCYKSVYAKTYTEVKEKLRNCLKSRSKSKYPESSIAFGTAADLWLEANKFRHKGATIMRYENLINRHIKPELKDIRLSQLNSTVISDFMNRKIQAGRLDGNGGLSSSYVRSIMLVLNSVINFSEEEKLCPPIQMKVYAPSVQKKTLQILNISDQKKLESSLLMNMDETALGIYLSLQMGLRLGEVCALKWDDIDFTNAVLHVRATIARVSSHADNAIKTELIRDAPKTKMSLRDIPIPSNVFGILCSVKEHSVSEYAISSTDTFVRPRTLEYRFQRILEKNSVPRITYHALRHTFATRCVEAEVDIKTLSEILGHSNVAITLNTYVHSSMDRKREQLEKLNHAIS